jgi:hypothetical protein
MYKIRKEDKRYEINFLVVTSIFIPYVLSSHVLSHLENYIKERLCLKLTHEKQTSIMMSQSKELNPLKGLTPKVKPKKIKYFLTYLTHLPT